MENGSLWDLLRNPEKVITKEFQLQVMKNIAAGVIFNEISS